jgi:hypothetical protein
VLNVIAERYVRLVLQIGQHDADYVDAFYGNPAWRPAGSPRPLEKLVADVQDIRDTLIDLTLTDIIDEMTSLRLEYLERQTSAAEARLDMLAGRTLSFDAESEQLYDAVAPRRTEDDFRRTLDELDRLLPGRGELVDRYTAFRRRYLIDRDRLDCVFRRAIDECRERTRVHLELPAAESFSVEYVTGQSWSAYNWYQGNFTSVIQLNTDLPITIDRAVDLAAHEGYPGHHVYQCLLEQALVRGRGWPEFTVYPLFSPQSLVSEGTANFGIEVAFPGDERVAFEREHLYELAGLDPDSALAFQTSQRLVDDLAYAGTEAARRYLDGELDRDGAIDFLMRWSMSPRDRASQRIAFFDRYRSYVINYTLGKDLVSAYIDRRGGTADRPDVRWTEFGNLLASPRLPSGLSE